MRRLLVILCLLGVCSHAQNATAQTAADELGAWYMYWGDNRLNEHLDLFTEAHLRLYEVASDPSDFMVRAGLLYIFDSGALAGGGYLFQYTWPFEGDENTTENRIWEQLVLHSRWSRVTFQHRYRLEQRWRTTAGVTDYTGRFRYRLLLVVPFKGEHVDPHEFFLTAANEIFLNTERPLYNQDRIYLALGYTVDKSLAFQVGYLFQILPVDTRQRLQFALVYNTDFTTIPSRTEP